MPNKGDTLRYFILNKPRNMVSQFVSPHKVNLLGDLDFDFPKGIHAVGRLDSDSEGLLLLTTNKKLTRWLFSGPASHERRYLVEVSPVLSEENLHKLRTGVSIRVKGGSYYLTPPCRVERIEDPEKWFAHGHQVLPYSKTTWVMISLREGKFRQVRKMIGALHHRCRRLIRVSIEDLHLGKLEPGHVKEMEESDILRQLKITPDD